jgi:hypothetical protein
MKRVLKVSSVLAAAILAVAGCNDYGNTFQNPTGATITSLSPSAVPAGSGDFTLTVLGGGFVTQTVVQWNGSNLKSTPVTDSSGNVLYITATVPANLTASPGTAFVNTLSPFSGAGNNGLSNTLNFQISPARNPTPSITSISPNIISPGSTSFTLMVNGSNFLPTTDPSGGSQVRWNAGPTQYTLPILSISSSQIQATVDSSHLQNQGCAIVTVYNPPSSGTPGNPGSGGGTSATTATFTVSTNPNFCVP